MPAGGTSHLPLYGRIAMVTGSSRGIGAGIAIELGRRGADVLSPNPECSNIVTEADNPPGYHRLLLSQQLTLGPRHCGENHFVPSPSLGSLHPW